MTDTLFKRLIQEHELWLSNPADGSGTAKAKKVFGKKLGTDWLHQGGTRRVLCVTVVGRKDTSKINVLRGIKPIALSVGARGISKKLAGNLHLLKEPDQRLGIEAEIGAGAESERRRRSHKVKGSSHKHL